MSPRYNASRTALCFQAYHQLLSTDVHLCVCTTGDSGTPPRTTFITNSRTLWLKFRPVRSWNHVGHTAAGYMKIYGGHDFGDWSTNGERIPGFAFANNLQVCNTFLQEERQPPHYIETESHGPNSTEDIWNILKEGFLSANKKCGPRKKASRAPSNLVVEW